MSSVLRVLLIEDSKDDADLLIRQLRKGGYNPKYSVVYTAESLKKALDDESWDIILCDYKMPNFNALEALKLVQQHGIDIPFIIVSGTVGEETAVESMKSGAHDFFVKDNLSKLVVAVEREIREAQNRRDKNNMENMLRKSEENFRHSLENSPMGVRIVSSEGETVYVNKELLNMYGYDSIDELNTIPHKDRYTSESLAERAIRTERRKRGDFIPNYEIDIIRKNGEIRHLEVFRKEVLWNGKKQYQALYNDITNRKLTEKKLRESENNYRLVVENAHETILITQDKKIVYANKAAENNLGYSLNDLMTGEFTRFIHPDDADRVVNNHIRRLRGEDLPSVYTFRIIRADKKVIWVEMNVTMIEWDKKPATLIFLKDITEHKLLDEERNESLIRIKNTLDATVNAIAAIVETRDPYTTGHQLRVSHLAKAIAEEMGLNNDEKDFIGTAAVIHDIGKLSIPAEILSKPTKLTDVEYALIKTHAQSGYNILKDIKFPWPVAVAILQHHERINGSGYPQNLEEKNILLESRILAVADVVEAISSHRPYRASLGLNYALDEISKNRGILYDANVVDACLRLFRDKKFSLT